MTSGGTRRCVDVFDGFGDNPGRLRMLAHLPQVGGGAARWWCCCTAAARMPLFSPAIQGGPSWLTACGFPLILPEQADANNAGRCFQWFQPRDTARDCGRSRIDRGDDPRRDQSVRQRS